MDTAMRDLEQIQETHHDDDGGTRRLGMLAMAALATVLLVFAMGSLLSAGVDAPAEPEDPLAALDRAAAMELDPSRDESADDDGEVAIDERSLRFHETLSAAPPRVDDRPEVEAAVAAAAAELAHPDPSLAPFGGNPALAGLSAPPAAAVVDALPAAVSAGPGSVDLSMGIPMDPMVAAALPQVAERREVAERASVGEEGRYTIQVISYRTRQEAEVFAEALRERGHQAFVSEADLGERGIFFRVRIGPFEHQREANQYRDRFEAEEQMNTYVVRRRDEEV